jgi:dihydroorotase
MGTTGVFTFPWYRSRVLEHCRTRLFEFINISSLGTIAVHTPYYVEHYGAYIDVPDTIRTIEENREYIRGIKVFASSSMVGESALMALRAARQVADTVHVPIAVHIGGAPPSLEEVLEVLQAGDIVTHSYTPGTQGILDESGKVRSAVREARQRGVRFDIGHGSGSFGFEVARRALDQNFAPDSISTDIYHSNVDGPVKDLLVTATKFLALGMSFDDVLARITVTPARMLDEESLASLAVGSVADVALLTLREGDFALEDARHQVLRTDRLLQCEYTLYDGQVIYQRMEV